MVDVIHSDYEVSVGSAEQHWQIPLANLEFATPVASSPIAVKSDVAGTQLTGVALVVDSTFCVGDFTPGNVYKMKVRNTLTYGAGPAEATWGAIHIGAPIYYDRSALVPADCHLSTSPLDQAGAANPLFGFRVPLNETDTADKGADGVASTQSGVAIMIIGAGR